LVVRGQRAYNTMKHACVAARIGDDAKRGAANMSILASRATKCPAQGGAGSKRFMLGWRVVGRKRGPSGDLTPETRIGPDTTRSRPVPRSHPRKRGPCSTFHRPPGAGHGSAGSAVLTRACTVASRKRVPAPRSGASPILAATPWKQLAYSRISRGLARVLAHGFVASPLLSWSKRRALLRALSQNRASASRVLPSWEPL
jgi:hypothetical protein